MGCALSRLQEVCVTSQRQDRVKGPLRRHFKRCPDHEWRGSGGHAGSNSDGLILKCRPNVHENRLGAKGAEAVPVATM